MRTAALILFFTAAAGGHAPAPAQGPMPHADAPPPLPPVRPPAPSPALHVTPPAAPGGLYRVKADGTGPVAWDVVSLPDGGDVDHEAEGATLILPSPGPGIRYLVTAAVAGAIAHTLIGEAKAPAPAPGPVPTPAPAPAPPVAGRVKHATFVVDAATREQFARLKADAAAGVHARGCALHLVAVEDLRAAGRADVTGLLGTYAAEGDRPALVLADAAGATLATVPAPRDAPGLLALIDAQGK